MNILTSNGTPFQTSYSNNNDDFELKPYILIQYGVIEHGTSVMSDNWNWSALQNILFLSFINDKTKTKKILVCNSM